MRDRLVGLADRAVKAAIPVVVVVVIGVSLWLLTATHLQVRGQAERAEERADRVVRMLLDELQSPDRVEPVDEMQDTLDRIVELLEED